MQSREQNAAKDAKQEMVGDWVIHNMRRTMNDDFDVRYVKQPEWLKIHPISSGKAFCRPAHPSEIPTDKPAEAGGKVVSKALDGGNGADGKLSVAKPLTETGESPNLPAQPDYIPARLDSEMGPVMRAFHEKMKFKQSQERSRSPEFCSYMTREDHEANIHREDALKQEAKERAVLLHLKQKYEK